MATDQATRASTRTPGRLYNNPANKLVPAAIVLILLIAKGAAAQQLSFRHYDVSEGLAGSHVQCVYQDSKGYLWFGTWGGLSRFDGYQFTSYGVRDGLRNPLVNCVAEDERGNLWVATNDGIARFEDTGGSSYKNTGSEPRTTPPVRFTSFSTVELGRPNEVNKIVFDGQGNVWCATDRGIFSGATGPSEGGLTFRLVAPIERHLLYGARIFDDSSGRIWSNVDGLVQIVGGRIVKYEMPPEISSDNLVDIWEDAGHRLLATFSSGIYEFVPSSAPGRAQWRKLCSAREVLCATEDDDGSFWIGTWKGLVKYDSGSSSVYTTEQGLSDNAILALSLDREGDLWIATQSGGVCELQSESIVSYTRREGLPQSIVANVVEDSDGRIYAITPEQGMAEITAGRAVPVPGFGAPPFSNLQHRILQDRQGYWWIGTHKGLFRSAGPRLSVAGAKRYGRADGIREDPIFYARGPSMYQDPAGVIWVSTSEYLYRYDPVRGPPFQEIPLRLGESALSGAVSMLMDPTGTLWIARFDGLFRLEGGQLREAEFEEAFPVTEVRCLFLDSRGWLWLGLRFSGVAVIQDPARQPASIVSYSTATGLVSDTVWSIAEDEAGRMYFGTEQGLDQLDVAAGKVRHFTAAEGLAGAEVNQCMRDKHGNIWVAGSAGLSKLVPRVAHASSGPPPIYLKRVQIAGEDLSLPDSGAPYVHSIELPYQRNNVLIEYAGISFRGTPNYQYRLGGVDSDWNPPTSQRSVNYARLAPGRYTFLVRVINGDGLASLEPASLEFRILPPFWQRWWAISIAGMVIAGMAYGIHRYRLARVLEVERVRTRIATDLHDDIGANLSLIAMSSEVAQRRVRNDPQLSDWLSSMASTSRDLVDSMSDIVWAVNPQKDKVGDLAHRMRGFASDILSTHEVLFRFRSGEETDGYRLGSDLRRELFLIFKEGINNAVRHSGATEVEVDFSAEGRSLLLEITDNGKGFDPGEESEGNGLSSMRSRAERLGGGLKVLSAPGEGTTLRLKVPIP